MSKDREFEKRDTGIYESEVSAPQTAEEIQAWCARVIEELSRDVDCAAMLNYFKKSARQVFVAGKLSGDPDKAKEVAEAAVKADAWKALAVIGLIERDCGDGRFDQAVGRAILLGRLVERMAVRWSEPHASRGRKTLGAAEKGHRRVHGDSEQKKRRWTCYQATLDSFIAKDIGIKAASRLAAEKHGVSLRSIERHTRDPRKTR